MSNTPRRRKRSTPRRPPAEPHFFSENTLSTYGASNNKILQYYYDSCQRHCVSPNPNASIAFGISSPYLLATKVESSSTELSHILPICETLAAFKNDVSINHLSFKSCCLGPMCVPALAACLKVNQTVKIIDLPGNLITDDVADAVGEIIVSAASLEILNIDANGMTKKAANIISSAILKNGGKTNLMKIDFTNNYLTQSGVDILHAASKETGIEISLETGNFCVEETWSAITHGCGSAWSITALVLLCQHAKHCHASERTWWTIMVYSISQLIMFLCSTMFHSFSCCVAPCASHIFGILDHSAIYLLIAGTYYCYIIIKSIHLSYFLFLN
jgi:hypothetical protein